MTLLPGCDYIDCAVPPGRHNRCEAAPVSRCWGHLEHQHLPRRAAGGKRAEAMLCSAHHGSCDQGLRYEGRRLGNRIVVSVQEEACGVEGPGRVYELYDRDTKVVLVTVQLEAAT